MATFKNNPLENDRSINNDSTNQTDPKILFQYQSELNLPIYIRANINDFNPSIISFFNKLHFSEVKMDDHIEQINKNINSRILNLEIASNRVAEQIESVIESDRFGCESIIPKDGYQVYRFRDGGMIIHSFGARVWSLGCFSDFGTVSMAEISHKIIINRFLSLSLSALGIVGFWGVPIEEGIVVMKPLESKGEAVYIDIRNKKILSIEGISSLKNNFKIIRLNKHLLDRNIRMNSEELMGFLSSYCTYFDFSGQSVAIRQMIRSLSKLSSGIIHPREKFLPRLQADLS